MGKKKGFSKPQALDSPVETTEDSTDEQASKMPSNGDVAEANVEKGKETKGQMIQRHKREVKVLPGLSKCFGGVGWKPTRVARAGRGILTPSPPFAFTVIFPSGFARWRCALGQFELVRRRLPRI